MEKGSMNMMRTCYLVALLGRSERLERQLTDLLSLVSHPSDSVRTNRTLAKAQAATRRDEQQRSQEHEEVRADVAIATMRAQCERACALGAHELW